ncbi:MAG: hypothetical protein EA361_02060 [Bacteroidetes bacterium]|nr:MAG: hypothetical protein EA361_02060 [Bacteroidota bacterium]
MKRSNNGLKGPVYEREKDYPRIDSPEDLFTASDLLFVEVPLKQLIVNQVEAAIRNANLLRGLR